MSPPPYRIVILGAGATGALVCAQLLKNNPTPSLQIHWIGDQIPFGRGLAFGTQDLDHLLNVRARGMSAFPDEPLHFFHWFKSTHPEIAADESTFLPRNYYGAYLEQLVPPKDSRVLRYHDEAIRIEGSGPYQVILGNGKSLEADEIILALGNLRKHPAYQAISPETLQTMAPHALKGKKILLLGTGLTLLDQLLTLKKRKGEYLLPLTAVSRRGLLPRVHTAYSPHSASPVFRATFMSGEHKIQSLAQALRIFRAECELASKRGSDWRAVFDEIRAHTQPLWSHLTARQKSSFMRHIRPYWDVHRHRVAPEIFDTIQALQKSGDLKILKKRITPEFLKGFDLLVDCTGLSSNISETLSPLAKSLIEKKLVEPDVPPVSFHQSPHHPRIHILGPLLRGSDWESIAVPEIRVQAEKLAKEILERANQ